MQLYDLPEDVLLDMGDFAGAVLKYLRRHPFPRLSIVGGVGKLTKLSHGHLDLGGPTAALLTPADASERVAAIHVKLPAGGGMPEHDHGASEVLLVPLAGSVEVRHGGQAWTLSVG